MQTSGNNLYLCKLDFEDLDFFRMDYIRDFFIDRGFDFDNGFLSEEISIGEKRIELKYYSPATPSKTSFYILGEELPEIELQEVRKFVWNENKADLLFTLQKTNKNSLLPGDNYSFNLYYAKLSPKAQNTKIDTFPLARRNSKKLETISKWQFESGAFWFNYREFLEKAKKAKTIDKELVNTLKRLKDSLAKNINDDEKVQALIDRTLYIKFLEDSHIINSNFYEHHFANANANYKEFLSKNVAKDLNNLFSIIHQIFGNELFDHPVIEEKYLTADVCGLIHNSISGNNIETGQLSLFDFQFNILPVEFISYIYEIFLSEKQKSNGIFYTPKKLAQLIIDDVIDEKKIGKILDPSCGSGMFLIAAFNKLLEISPEKKNSTISEKIKHRIQLLSENIFGIEKQPIAQRFTLFSLSLQIFRGLDPQEIKQYISKQLNECGEVRLFRDNSFFGNIICQNSLEVDEIKKPFRNTTFDYIVGNPPFFEIKETDEEISFINKFSIKLGNNTIKAKQIIGKHQISQCFLMKIKEWSSDNTRFGFVCNNSNFYNDKSEGFQNFFYRNYNVEKIYELSKVKKILFEKAKESVNTLIFTNKLKQDNIIQYYPIEMGIFSEKPFELLIIQEDNIVQIKQSSLIDKDAKLRDYMVGNEYDWKLLNKLKTNVHLENYLLLLDGSKDLINNGIQIVGKEQILNEFNISTTQWAEMTAEERKIKSKLFKQRYTSTEKNHIYRFGLYLPENIHPFRLSPCTTYLGPISNFQRIRNPNIYEGNKILINRVGQMTKAVFVDKKEYYGFDVYSIFLKDENLYYFISALINSKIVNFFIDILYRKRADGSYPKIGYEAIKKIPIPIELDADIVSEISHISKKLASGESVFDKEQSDKINNLFFELYGLSFLEKQRITDYFKPKSKVTRTELDLYKQSLLDTIEAYIINPIQIDVSLDSFGLVVAKVSFTNKDLPTTGKTSKYTLNEIFKHDAANSAFTTQEKIFGKEAIYIIRNHDNLNWTETIAYEDGQEILKRIN